MSIWKFKGDITVAADRYIEMFDGETDKATLTEEIDAAYARANSIEANRDMTKGGNLSRKKAWIQVAQALQEKRKAL